MSDAREREISRWLGFVIDHAEEVVHQRLDLMAENSDEVPLPTEVQSLLQLLQEIGICSGIKHGIDSGKYRDALRKFDEEADSE